MKGEATLSKRGKEKNNKNEVEAAREKGRGEAALGLEEVKAVQVEGDDDGAVDVVYAADAGQWEGLKASIASVCAHALRPEQLTVHVLAEARRASALARELLKSKRATPPSRCPNPLSRHQPTCRETQPNATHTHTI